MPARPGRLRVLLAEDDGLIGLAAEAVLRDAGHVVVRARDRADALMLARGGEEPWDVLVTDLSMPRLDGAALIRTLRAERPSLPVVTVTGYALSAEDRAVLGGAGPLVRLSKPWTPEAMVAAVQRVAAMGRGG